METDLVSMVDDLCHNRKTVSLLVLQDLLVVFAPSIKVSFRSIS